jgi:hypothetical protein
VLVGRSDAKRLAASMHENVQSVAEVVESSHMSYLSS